MVTSATIDISKYVGTTETSSASSHSDKSCDFGNVLDNVNKAFNSNQSSNSNVSDAKTSTQPETKTTTQTDTTKQTQNVAENSDKKVEAKNSDDKTVENKTNKEELKDKTTDSDTKETEDAKPAEKTTNDDSQNIDKTDLSNQPTVLTNNILEAIENTAPAIVAPPINTNNDTTAATTNQADTTTAGQAISTDNQIQTPAINLNTDLSQITQNLTNNFANQVPTDKTSTQVQQPVNSKVEQQNIQPQDIKQDAPQAVATDTSAQLKVPTEAIAPIVVAANANVKTDANVSNKEDTALSKTALTQDMLDKTNARVVSVDTNSSNSSNSNNLLNKQNAQEQAIKFSLESNNKSTNASKNAASSELPNIADTTSQVNFSKTLDAVSVQPTKELSHSDILSQINKQLDGLKEEGTTRVTIVLRPENLGKINLELVNSKDGLTASMTTDSPQVKELLDKSLNSLKDTLGNQGVSVNNVSVKLNETQKQDNTFSFNEHTGQQQQNSQTPKQTNGSEFSFEKEMNSATGDDAETEISVTTGSESSVSIGSHMGKVDYKV